MCIREGWVWHKHGLFLGGLRKVCDHLCYIKEDTKRRRVKRVCSNWVRVKWQRRWSQSRLDLLVECKEDDVKDLICPCFFQTEFLVFFTPYSNPPNKERSVIHMITTVDECNVQFHEKGICTRKCEHVLYIHWTTILRTSGLLLLCFVVLNHVENVSKSSKWVENICKF